MFSRFEALPSFSEQDLDALNESKVAIVGLGATGSAIAENLARHGAELVLIDRDYLEMNDVYSSSIYTPEMCEQMLPKAKAAEQYLSKFTDVRAVQDNLDSENISILDGCDLVMDGTDNLKTRFLISEHCSREDTPWIYTAAIGEKGYSMFFDEKCFSCVFEDIQAGSLETCETAGILREISSMAAASSARKAVNYLTGKKVEEKLDMIPSGRTLNVSSDGCKVCEEQSFQYLNHSSSTSSVCGKDKYHVDLNSEDLDLEDISDKLDAESKNNYLVRAVFEGRKLTVFKEGRAIVEAEDEGHAEQLVSEKLGI